ncbi:sigma-E processing peptidase SpoIIGA [Clostridium sp. Sa3CUN1]|uniref:Sporulation sigma-E factor-processing peptidase n=1 Tax=Clostridium gallinarum TaxID=2762246 RepID=A0ABR8Q162_9CLOT|nr:sigma-E processing peptidase SpoIIGA [Clostridium gallinarum]MBD7914144.1 sigma-E processing peptidase SpoIIGA [Clostridium gallinarum]
MVVYIDILLIENFIINLFLLLITLKALRYKYYKSIYIAALFGALYTLIIFMDNKILVSLPFKIIVVLLMIIISTKNLKIIKVLKSSVVFILMSFTLCGFTFAFSMIDNSNSIFEKFSINKYSIKYLIISVMILYIVSVRVTEYLRDRNLLNNFIYDIEIFNGKKSIFIKGLLDTGNALREPVTNLPCIIVESDFFNDLELNSNNEFLIPYSTIGEDGLLKGFKSKDIRIRGEDKKWRNVEVILCECKNKLSKENDFNALLSRGVI